MKNEELSDKKLSHREQDRIFNPLVSSRSGTVVAAIVIASWLWLLIVWVSR